MVFLTRDEVEVKILCKLERLLLVLGLLLVASYVAVRIHGGLSSRAAMREFAAVPGGAPANLRSEVRHLAVNAPDFALWSPKRIKDYQGTLKQQFSPALAILKIPKIKLEVPVLEGTDDLTLNRGVGRIPGTAQLQTTGNVGFAGHRDGFFRGLKDVSLGDRIHLVTPATVQTYLIDRILIVSPNDLSVLQARDQASITLVTCYPFYFVGSAPQRYIVQAVLTESQYRPAQANGH